MNIRAFLTLAIVVSTASANAQFQFPMLPAKPAGYIVIDCFKPGSGPGQLVAALDVDGDGNLSWAEIEKAPLALGRLDRNRNGRLDSSEIAPRPTEISRQRSAFVAEFGIRHADCHDIKQALDIPKIITNDRNVIFLIIDSFQISITKLFPLLSFSNPTSKT